MTRVGLSGAVLANPFVIEVRDENLAVLEEISVTFAITAGDGTLNITHTTTDEKGRAESTFTLGPNLKKILSLCLPMELREWLSLMPWWSLR